jgi:hypothetical protein
MHKYIDTLPRVGHSRWKQIKPFVGVSRETWRNLCIAGSDVVPVQAVTRDAAVGHLRGCRLRPVERRPALEKHQSVVVRFAVNDTEAVVQAKRSVTDFREVTGEGAGLQKGIENLYRALNRFAVDIFESHGRPARKLYLEGDGFPPISGLRSDLPKLRRSWTLDRSCRCSR